MSPQSQAASAHVVSESRRCAFRTSDRRQCTMLRQASHPSLCLDHARKARLLLESEITRQKIASLYDEFHTCSNIRQPLATLWALLAEGRISNKRAASLAHLAAER